MKNYDLTGGTPSKPYPEEANFIVDASATSDILGESRTVVTQEDYGNVVNHFGQVKYAVREGAVSIYKDETRQTNNDREASAKAEGSCVGEMDSVSNSQGGAY